MTLLQKIKKIHSNKFNQLILMDKDARVVNSCNSIFNTTVLGTQSAKEWYPFIESIFEDVWNLKEQIRFAKVETNLVELPGTYDFTFAKIKMDDSEFLLWSIYNYTDLYNDLKNFQQSRNELEIRRETIEKKCQQLVDFNEVLVEKNTELENINQLHQDYYRTVKNALRSPINTLDSVNSLLSKFKDGNNSDYVSGLKNSIQSIQNIVDELEVLNTSFSAEDKNGIESFDLYNLTVEVIDTFKKNTTAAKQLIFHIDDKTPHILKGKPKKLQQILYCLMMNSYKLNKDAALEIIISPIDIQAGTAEILYEVKERNITTLNQISADKINGLQLRLELVRKLIELENGRISIEHDDEQNIVVKTVMKHQLP